MNLSKVYNTSETFQPEDIIRSKLKEPVVFDSSIITSDQPYREFQRQPLTSEHPASQPPPQDEEGPPQQNREEPASEAKPKAPASPKPERRKEPAPDLVSKPPPPPPGIPQEEVERMVSEAYEKGLVTGLQQAEQDFGGASASLLLACQQLDTLRETVIQNSVGEIQDLVLAIAEKIIRHSVQQQSQTIVSTVEEAIQKAVKSGEFYIHVHPDDYAVIASKAEEMVAGINGLHNIVVKIDANIDRGGCRIDSDTCTVDATISGQLGVIRDHLRQQ